MTYARRACVCASLLALCTALGGCGLNQPYPEKDLFTIDVTAPTPAAEKTNGMTLRVRRLRVASPYDGKTFVYRIDEGKFRTDYYNGFIVEPAQLLTAELIEWLSASGPFASVLDSGSAADHTLVLEGAITSLYGDYTDPKAPQAVLAAKFFLLDDRAAETRVIYQKPYKVASPVADDTPAALVKAWEQAYAQMLKQLAADLGRVQLPG